ncbi:MAG: hypothetical protein KA783_01965, partial [Chitinophagales bacterium]|nr:hypothetical protein [Chitinophagales bacterium]
MNKHLLLALLCFFFVASNAYAQLFQTPLYDQPEQNCIDAIPICGNSISNDDYYIGFGEELELEPNQNCMVSGEINSVWYVFSIKQSGTLGFTINTSDDYDFSLWNIT